MKYLILVALVFAAIAGYLTMRGGDEVVEPMQPDGVPTTNTTFTEPGKLPDTPRTDPEDQQVSAGETELDPAAADEGALSETDQRDPRTVLAELDLEVLLQSFEDRHGHLTVNELRDSLTTVEKAIADQKKILFADRFDRGIYDVQVLGNPAISPPEADERGRLPLQNSRTSTDPTTMRMEAHIATLPIDEFPALYELLDERDWLRKRIGN
jgi:hypothetical protein